MVIIKKKEITLFVKTMCRISCYARGFLIARIVFVSVFFLQTFAGFFTRGAKTRGKRDSVCHGWCSFSFFFKNVVIGTRIAAAEQRRGNG